MQVTLSLSLHGGLEKRKAFVAKDGAFKFEGVPPGTHKLEIDAEGAPIEARLSIWSARGCTRAWARSTATLQSLHTCKGKRCLPSAQERGQKFSFTPRLLDQSYSADSDVGPR